MSPTRAVCPARGPGEDYAQWRAQAARNRGYYRVELQEPMTGWTICLEVSLAPVYAQTRDMRTTSWWPG